MKRLLCIAALVPSILSAQGTTRAFKIEETTISAIHAAFKPKTLTCHALVQRYLTRIAAYDKNGPAINAIVTLNPRRTGGRRFARQALREGGAHRPAPLRADDREGQLRDEGPANHGRLARPQRLDSAAGCDDGRAHPAAAGAIVLAKSGMAEWAFSPRGNREFHSSRLHEESVRAGSRHCEAPAAAHRRGRRRERRRIGTRLRHGQLHSRPVVAQRPRRHSLDDGTHLARRRSCRCSTARTSRGRWRASVAERRRDLQRGRRRRSRRPCHRVEPGTSRRGLPEVRRSRRAGRARASASSARRTSVRRSTATLTVAVFTIAIHDLEQAGATIVDPAGLDSLASLQRSGGGGCAAFKYDLERCFAARGQNAPVKTIDEILRSNNYHPSANT